jgi:CIC family chloride channel protein
MGVKIVHDGTRTVGLPWLWLLAVLVGLVAGLGAVVFRGLIGLFHNLLFLGQLSVFYDANIHTPPSPWGPLVIFVPVVGALGVAFLVEHFAPEAKGHGVPEVMDAIYYHRGKIRPVVAVVKAVASALSIGTGGSVGREGPIIQIGASFGSTLGQLTRLSPWQCITLIAGGAGGGIAATFNTPIGGLLFAVELMMTEVTARTLVPVAIATETATYVGWMFFGVHPSFTIPALQTPSFTATKPLLLLAYAGLGALMGLGSALFIRSIYAFEDFFERRVRGSYYRQHLGGMFLVGGILYAMMAVFGHYYVEGVGYATVQDVLSRSAYPLYLLLLLFILKLITTSLTLGSGASGGIFSPSLFMGAALGGAYAVLLQWLLPTWPIELPAFAVAGMAAMVGGATGAALAAIMMIFEMTLDYSVILPMAIAVAISWGVRRILSPESIYTMKLVRHGHYVPQGLQTASTLVRHARDVMSPKPEIVPSTMTVKEFARRAADHRSMEVFLVADRDRIVGFVRNTASLDAFDDLKASATLDRIARTDYATVDEQTTLLTVVARMRTAATFTALVTDGSGTISTRHVRGVITARQIADATALATDLLAD